MGKVIYDEEHNETYGYTDAQAENRLAIAEEYNQVIGEPFRQFMKKSLEAFLATQEVKEASDTFDLAIGPRMFEAFDDYMHDFSGDYLYDLSVQRAIDSGGEE